MTLERRDKKRRKTKSDVEYALRVARDLNLELHLKKSYLPPSILRKTNLATFSNTLNAKPTIIRTPAERIHVAATVASAASGLKAGGNGEEERSPP